MSDLGAWYDFLYGARDPGSEADLGVLPDPGSEPVTILFDPSLPYTEQPDAVNRGCPPGYFAQYVASGEANATYVAGLTAPGGTTMLRCRKMEGYTAHDNEQETGQAAAEAWNRFAAALPDPHLPLDLMKTALWIIGGILVIQVLGMVKKS
jgi:hypothetical protein